MNEWDRPKEYPVEVNGEVIGSFYFKERDGMLHGRSNNGGHKSCSANGEDIGLGRLLVRTAHDEAEKLLKEAEERRANIKPPVHRP